MIMKKSQGKTRKSSFYPIADLEHKSNYKHIDIIEKDGSILERVFLDIPDVSIRETVICNHYFQYLINHFYKKAIRIDVLSRDNPWDFKIRFSTNEVFNVEITSIADDSSIFEKFKREERFKIRWFEEKIPLHELEKLNAFFPNPSVENAINLFNQLKTPKAQLVDNPFCGMPHLIIGGVNEKEIPLHDLILEAIHKKEEKKHKEKENTVIIIDNRTMLYEIPDLHSAVAFLEDKLNSCPFKEIWFYTGYYSSLDCKDAEYCLVPLKTTMFQKNILLQMIVDNPPNSNGIIYTNV